MKKSAGQALLLVPPFVLVYLWTNNDLGIYTPGLIGGLTLFYLMLSLYQPKNTAPEFVQKKKLVTVLLLSTLVILLVAITGGINSPFFFLFFFLSFALAFLFAGEMSFALCFGVLLFFFPAAEVDQNITNFIRLASLLLLTPIAFFFGREVKLREARERSQAQMEQEIKQATDTILQDVSVVVKNEAKNLKETDISSLKDIVTQSKRLRESTKE